MSDYTPGPWFFGKLGNNADQWSVFDNTGRDIGISYHGEDNAALMAAAPDMLAALESIVGIGVDDDGDIILPAVSHNIHDAPEPYELIEAINAAIDKARGKS